ncbi:FCD domain-containing protein [Streptomyces purpurascens]
MDHGRRGQGPPGPGPATGPARERLPAVFADQHQEIFDAVVSGDLALARTAMRTHLRAVFSDIERIRTHSPELFATGSSSVPVRRNVVVWE